MQTSQVAPFYTTLMFYLGSQKIFDLLKYAIQYGLINSKKTNVIQNLLLKSKITTFANQLLKKESIFLLPLYQILKI